MKWTLSEITFLKRRYALGMTMTALAKELRRSRGSVVGKIHRLKLIRSPEINRINTLHYHKGRSRATTSR